MFLSLILAVTLTGRPVAIPAHAEPSTRLAATELTNYLSRITGVASPLIRLPAASPVGAFLRNAPCPAVVIGTLKTLGDSAPAAAREALAKTDDIEAAWTGTDGDRIWIVGKNEVAELYATYHFLESKLGVRWFQAWTKEDPGDYVPEVRDLAVGDFAEFREPAFKIRRVEAHRCFANVPATNAASCAVRNGFQINSSYATRIPYENPSADSTRFYAPRVPHKLVNLGGEHTTFSDPCPPGKGFKAHPAWFARVNGRRIDGNQYCISNPELRAATVAHILRQLDRDGGDGQYVFGMWDTSWGWCECDACRALDGDDRPVGDMPNVSTRFNATVKELAAKVWEKYPKADLRMWAYHTYRQVPQGVRHDPRLKICFCDHGRCYAHALDDPTCLRNVEIFRMLRAWAGYGNPLYVYAYLSCTDPYYTCNEAMQADDIRKYVKLGVMGWKEEGVFSDSKFVKPAPNLYDVYPSNWQWLYVTGHLLWDPSFDEKALLADAESKYYGAAYPAMKDYHALRRKLWAEGRGCMGYPRGDQRRPALLDAPGAKEKLLALLDAADRLAERQPVLRHRLARDRRWLTTYWINPNEAFKKKMAQAIRAPKTSGKVTVDGVADEPAWRTAAEVPADLLRRMDNKQPFPPSQKTTIRVMRDEDNLYFHFTALEPDMDKVKMHARRGDLVWGDDSMEVILFPPSIENQYYQLGMTPKGGLSAEMTGRKAPGEFGVEFAGKTHPDRYEMELRVPVKGMYPLTPGEVWKINLCRSRVLRGEFNHTEEHYSIGGIGFLSTDSYHPLVIGE